MGQLLQEEGIELAQLEPSVRLVFKKIALTFSPHKAAAVREVELQEILKRCTYSEDRLLDTPGTLLCDTQNASGIGPKHGKPRRMSVVTPDGSDSSNLFHPIFGS